MMDPTHAKAQSFNASSRPFRVWRRVIRAQLQSKETEGAYGTPKVCKQQCANSMNFAELRWMGKEDRSSRKTMLICF